MKHQRIFEELSDFREKDCGGQKDDHQMAMTNQGDGTGVEPGCCRNDHKMAMTNHFRPMVRVWSLGVVGATTGTTEKIRKACNPAVFIEVKFE